MLSKPEIAGVLAGYGFAATGEVIDRIYGWVATAREEERGECVRQVGIAIQKQRETAVSHKAEQATVDATTYCISALEELRAAIRSGGKEATDA